MKEASCDLSTKLQRPDAAHLDEILDEALRQTFPASDPVAIAITKPQPDEQPSRTAPPSRGTAAE
jgi:hypothetical protein